MLEWDGLKLVCIINHGYVNVEGIVESGSIEIATEC